ncbi:MAG: aspartate aminotransferase family protein [Pirellulaceae bacterium]|jgi:4-aminobutyrate aminotransferase-like enzyme|nr:aspartate aminotransferase family protein [Pirellulaceae bacterium]HJN13335.1 aspartate aminotransferase family protein [Pirellulaceae bacterium]
MSNENQTDSSIQHPGEESSNVIRQRLTRVEPRTLRTFTPSLALISKSAGSYHFTPEGRKLADFSSGVLVSNLGHNPTRWWKRLLDNLGIRNLDERAEFTVAAPLTAYNAATELEVEASERLLANIRSAVGGGRMEQVLWAASGSEAVQKALWASMSRDPQRNIILATRGGFHGKKGLAGAVTGSETDKERDPRVRFISFPVAECDDLATRREALDLEKYRQELASLDQELGSQICCLITEPYLGGGGSYHPQPEYLQMLQQFCRDHDVIFILDEIQSNFGRTGPMYAFTHYGIEPDIVCLGKGLGNGVPVSAAVGRRSIFGGLGYGEGSDTWSANPLSSAAVLATLDEFEQDDVLARGQELAAELEAGLQRLKETGVIVKVRGEGCVWGIECAGFDHCKPEQVANLCVEACYRGDAKGRAIHLLGPLAGKVIRVSPPLVMTVAEAREYLKVMYGIFSALAAKLVKS